VKTSPITGPLAKAHARAARRIAADRKQAPEELGELFEYLEEHFFDADLTVGKLEREGRVDNRLHKLFVKTVGLPVKRYLLRRKRDMAEWLLRHTHFDVDDVAVLLRYGRSANFSRDFNQWTGQTPERYRRHRVPPRSTGRPGGLAPGGYRRGDLDRLPPPGPSSSAQGPVRPWFSAVLEGVTTQPAAGAPRPQTQPWGSAYGPNREFGLQPCGSALGP
jgi:AraC-like DNA-binding protein